MPVKVKKLQVGVAVKSAAIFSGHNTFVSFVLTVNVTPNVPLSAKLSPITFTPVMGALGEIVESDSLPQPTKASADTSATREN